METTIKACGVLWLLLAGNVISAADTAKITFEEHVRPIFREHCFSCHNQNKARNDLALDSYERIMKGGASGEAIKPGDPSESYLYRVVTHEDEPKMPPGQEKLASAKLDLIKQWISGGALKDSGSTAAVAKPKTELSMAISAGRPAGPAIVPEGLRKEPFVRTSRPGAVTAIAASPWAPVLAVAGQKQIYLYHSGTAQLLGLVPFEEGVPYVLRFSRSGATLLAAGGHGGKQGRAVLFDVKTGKRLAAVGDELDAVLAADIHASQSRVALGGPEKILRVYATSDGSQLHQIRKHTDWVLAVAYSPDGVLLASGDRSGGLLVWEADGMNEYQTLDGHKGAITAVSWRPDSNVLASSSEDGTIRLWEMNDGKQIRNFRAHDGGVLSVEFLHDGRLVSAGRDRKVKLWAADGKMLREFGPMADIALHAVANDDGSRVAGGDWTGLVLLWNSSDGKQAARLSGP